MMQTARTLATEPVPELASNSVKSNKKVVWTGRVISAVPALLLIMAGTMKILRAPGLAEGFNHAGIPMRLATGIGILEISCAVIYLIPRTAVLGAILVAAYLGGATVTEVRIGESWVIPVLLGVLAWGGLFLRDARVRELIPLRRGQ